MNDLRKLKKKPTTSRDLPLAKQRPAASALLRDPLKDLNNRGAAQQRDRQRSSNSSSSTSTTVLPRLKPQRPKTPQSAPPGPRIVPSSRTNPPSRLTLRTQPRPATDAPRAVSGGKCCPNGSKVGFFSAKAIYGGDSHVGSRKKSDLGGETRLFRLQLQSTPEKDGERWKQNEPEKAGQATTPPIHSSISPEITCMPQPTPACFAAGHLIAGVRDRRKCRPRGILRAGEDCKEVRISSQSLCEVQVSTEDGTGGSPHPARASIHWLSSGEINWAVQPSDEGDKPICSEGSPLCTTPTSDVTDDIWRTPSSNSSISPFSMILKKAAASSGSGALRHEAENMPSSLEFSGCGSNAAPSSQELSVSDSVAKDFKIPLSSSPERRGGNLGTSSKFQASSFQFGCTAVSSESVDLDKFRKSPCLADPAIRKVQLEEKCSGDPGMRISWREGLVSRIFEMQKFVDDDDDEDEEGKDALEDGGYSVSSPNGQSSGNGFGSIEYVPNLQTSHRQGIHKRPPEIVPVSESMSIESELFASSSDSDWRVFFRNHLFES